MRTSRFAAAAAAASISLFGVGVASALADTAPVTTTTAAPKVTLTGSTYTVAIPGVGDVSFALDAQGVASNVTFTVASGALTTTPETEVSVTIPAATNTPVRIVTISVEREDGALKVSVESDDEQGDDQASTETTSTTPSTTKPEVETKAPTTSAPATPEVEKADKPEVTTSEKPDAEKPEKAEVETHSTAPSEHETND
ncbi:MAG: hypothetical protein NVS3B12_30490 [Acidimicrobiales bacterium]